MRGKTGRNTALTVQKTKAYHEAHVADYKCKDAELVHVRQQIAQLVGSVGNSRLGNRSSSSAALEGGAAAKVKRPSRLGTFPMPKL